MRWGEAGGRAVTRAFACALAVLALAPAPASAALPASCSRISPLASTVGELSAVSVGDVVIRGTLYLPRTATIATTVPVVLTTHGGGGSRTSLAPRGGNLSQRLLDAGYGVLAYDTRGHGASKQNTSGQAVARWDWGSEEVQGEDVAALLRELAGCRVVTQEAPGDPLAGAVGVSNAGGVQLNAAARTAALDAIVPELAWGQLDEDLVPQGAPKEWLPILRDHLVAAKVLIDPAIDRLAEQVRARGAITDEGRAWLAARSTSTRLDRVAVPTLLIAGTVDTLFPLAGALRAHAELDRRGVPVRLLALCRAHGRAEFVPTGTCASTRDPKEAIVAWLDRWLMALPVDTGPAVEWDAQDGTTRTAPAVPSASTTVTASSLGELRGTAGDGGDTQLHAGPAPRGEGLRAPLLGGGCRALLGTASVTLEGTLAGEPGHVFAELVDVAPDGSERTVGVQSAPIALPAGAFAVSAPLPALAWTLAAGHRLELELTAGSAFFHEPGRSFAATVARASVELPAGAAC